MLTELAEIGAALVPATSQMTVKLPPSGASVNSVGLTTAKVAIGARADFEVLSERKPEVLAEARAKKEDWCHWNATSNPSRINRKLVFIY